MKTNICIFILVCLLASCQEKKKDNLQVPVKEMVCECQKEIQCCDSVEISQVFRLYHWKIMDDKIVFCSNNLDDFISVYSYPQLKFLYSFGKTGQGPGEFVTKNWGNNKEPGFITLYDIMKSSLYKYKIENSEFALECKYSLLKDDDNLCRPFTKIIQMNDSVFIMKEDGRDTKLHLANLRNQQDYDTYQCTLREQCALRKGESVSYTAFNYDFDVIGNHILLAYNYIDRLELLHLNEGNKIVPQLILGSDEDQMDSPDPDLKCYFLDIGSYDNLFLCLKTKNGVEEEGNVLCIFDIDGNYKSQIILDQCVSSIDIDKMGTLVAYKEKVDSSTFYRYNLKKILNDI